MKRRDLTASDPYHDAWQEFRRISRRSLLRFFLFFFGGFGLTWAGVGTLFPNAPGWLGPAAAVPWLVALIVSNQAPLRWPCPRCAKRYFSTTWGYNTWARRCLNCGLPKWAPRDVDPNYGRSADPKAGGSGPVLDVPRLFAEPGRRMREIRARVDGWSVPRASVEPQNNEMQLTRSARGKTERGPRS